VESTHLIRKSPLLINEEHVAHVLEIFLREELRRTGLTQAVIGLSGGVDSALSTYLTARALGAQNVHVVLMPYKASSPESLADAMVIVKDLKLSHEVFEITGPADAFIEATERTGKKMDKLRRGNMFARMRMITLYDRSQSLGALVIGTSNKTESLLGYTTLYGDNASAINPLGDLYKTQVWQLSKYVSVPKQIVTKSPSADLWPGQTDETEMGISYHEVDELLFYMIDERLGDEALADRGFDPKFIARIRTMIQRSQFKRQPPIIAKISSRTINADFRYPRDWGT
jgi:NAD+ synthase